MIKRHSIQQRIHYLEHFNSLQQMGFSVKATLESLKALHPQHNALQQGIQKKLNDGQSLYAIFYSLLNPYSDLQLKGAGHNIQVNSWLHFALTHVKEKLVQGKLIKQKLIYSGSLAISSLGLFAYLATSYSTRIKQSFQGVDMITPRWLSHVSTAAQLLSSYGLLLVAISLCLALVFERPLKAFLAKHFGQLFFSSALSDWTLLIAEQLKQGQDLLDISKQLSVSKAHPLYQRLSDFTGTLQRDYNILAAFQKVFPNPHHHSILIQCISSNTLDKGLLYLATHFREQQLKRLSLLSKVLMLSSLALTALLVFAGFYITMLPMTALIRSLQ